MNKEDLFDYGDKWFVLMHESLYYEDQTLIGFRSILAMMLTPRGRFMVKLRGLVMAKNESRKNGVNKYP